MTECQCGGQPDGPHTDICYLQGEIERLRAELASSASRVSELTSALTLAIDLVDHWGAYASPYFQKKHGLDRDLSTLRAALKEEK